jgi:glycosyltransferase involved in cell wall biosynthesis
VKIGILTKYFALGKDTNSGLGRHYRWLADELVNQGHEVSIFYIAAPNKLTTISSDLAELTPAWSVTLIPESPPMWMERVLATLVRSKPGRALIWQIWCGRKASKVISKALREHHLDIIETHSYQFPVLSLLKLKRRPPVVSRVATTSAQLLQMSGVSSRVLTIASGLERKALVKSDCIVTHTRQHLEVVCTMESIDPQSVEIVMLGLPVAAASTNETKEIIKNDGEVNFLFVGRFELRKGIDVLLESIPQIAHQFPNATFTLVGNTGSEFWPEFESKYPSLTNRRVRSLGKVSDETLNNLYQRCDIFVAPSRYESFGLIYVEAMSRSKPVIGCRAGGIPEVVKDGVSGLLAEAGDAVSLTKCMARLAVDINMRDKMSRAAYQDYLDRFTVEVMTKESLKLYRKVIRTSSDTRS